MAKPKPKPKPKPKKRSWVYRPGTDHVVCYPSSIGDCLVIRLWEGRRSDFHDAELQNATAEINQILDRVERDNKDSSRNLSFINFESRLMLVWTHPGEVISSDDADGEIAKGLKIKGFDQR
jgi:hypothetical protein